MDGLSYDGYVVHKINKLKRFGALAYLLSGLASLLLYKKSTFKIALNGISIEEKCLMTLFGICKFSGSGMQLTKHTKMNNGLLNITIAKNLTVCDLLLNIRKLYSGEIVYHKKISTYTTDKISVIPFKSIPYIQADGEFISRGAVQITIIKEAIIFVIS
jgi:diacylglycerol kinase family enzyme